MIEMTAADPTHFLNQVRKNYDRLSSIYDFISGNSELKITRRVIEHMGKRQPEKILDIGCGTGNSLIEIKKDLKNQTHILGLDLSYKMCQKARNKLNGLEGSADADVICSNALSAPYAENSLNAILLSFTLELLPGELMGSLLDEIARLLVRDGYLYVIHMAEEETNSIISNLYKRAHKKFPRLIDCRPISATNILERRGYKILYSQMVRLWGLPVGILEATKGKD